VIEGAAERAAAAEADAMARALCLPAQEEMAELEESAMWVGGWREGGMGMAITTIRFLRNPLTEDVNPGGGSYMLRSFLEEHAREALALCFEWDGGKEGGLSLLPLAKDRCCHLSTPENSREALRGSVLGFPPFVPSSLSSSSSFSSSSSSEVDLEQKKREEEEQEAREEEEKIALLDELLASARDEIAERREGESEEMMFDWDPLSGCQPHEVECEGGGQARKRGNAVGHAGRALER